MSQDFIDSVLKVFAKAQVREAVNVPAVNVEAGDLVSALEAYKKDLKMDMLLDHTAIDLVEEGKFELVYQLFSARTGEYLSVYTRISREHPQVASASKLWAIAEFQEREVFDFFGVEYENHPDLRRLFLEDDWQGYPLRKDYKDDFMLELPDHG